MIIAEAEISVADLLRLQEDLNRLELGQLVKIVSVGRTKIGIFVTHSMARELWVDSMARGLLHEWGWAGKFFEHKPVFPAPNGGQK